MATEEQFPRSTNILEDTDDNVEEKDVTDYLKDGCNVNEKDENGNTPLHHAISSDASIDVLRILLQKGASVTATNTNDYLKDGCDVNEQDENGNTSLHRAISSDASIDELRNLLQKGASVTATNKKGHNPLQFINGSVHTALNLLKLENEFDLRDDDEQTFFHRLMGAPIGDDIWGRRNRRLSHSEKEALIGQFWEVIVNENKQFDIDPNIQDKFGNTPLHVAAINGASFQHMVMMLSHFPNLDPLLVNSKGNTFLHEYCKREFSEHISYEFDTCLLQGDLKACPRTVLKQLLNCQNKQKETPIHTLVHRTCFNSMSADLLRSFAATGVDLNIPNYHGNTVLHCLIRGCKRKYGDPIYSKGMPRDEEIDTDDCIEFIVRNGAYINKRNILGVTPLFLADRVNTVSVLLDNGANVDERNGLNQTPLISYLCRPGSNIDIINYYLERGADINARDKYGSSALHYAAWNDVGLDIVDSLIDHGVKLQPDSLDQLPCHVAYWRRSKEIFDSVCLCKDGLHKGTEHFSFKQTMMEISELVNSESEVLERAYQHFEVFRGCNIAKVLQMPGFGLVRFDENSEATDVKSKVTECISKICEEVAKEDTWLSCKLIQSGSVRELTKVGLPDEFDFVCIFEKLSEVCYIDEQKSSTDPGFVYLKLKPEFNSRDCNVLFDKDGYLDTMQVRSRFQEILIPKLKDCTIFCNPDLTFLRYNYKGANKPTLNFTLKWIGAFYKSLVINIDMVPACQIKGFWPIEAKLNSLECDVQKLMDEGSLLILQTESDETLTSGVPHLRISALRAEHEHMQNLPSIAKDAYVVSKILYNNRICPTLYTYWDMNANEFITSYMLKTCMFHLHHTSELNKEENMDVISKSDKDRYNDALYSYVLRIYKTILTSSEKEDLQSFIFPWQNVFTFSLNEMDDPTIHRYIHNKCLHRCVFAKIILNILGENNHFSDVDIITLCQHPDDDPIDVLNTDELSDLFWDDSNTDELSD